MLSTTELRNFPTGNFWMLIGGKFWMLIDSHIRVIDQHGHIAWQKKTGYGLRNYTELALQRYKRIFGNAVKAHALPQQKNRSVGKRSCAQ